MREMLTGENAETANKETMSEKRLDKAKIYGSQKTVLDTSKARFVCIQAVAVGSRVHSLWQGQLPDGRDLLIASVNRPRNSPTYDRGFCDRNEALGFFSRYMSTVGV